VIGAALVQDPPSEDPASAENLETLLAELPPQLLLFGLLVAGASLAFTLITLRLLHREAPERRLPRPRWGEGEIILAFGFWFLSQNLAVLAANLLAAAIELRIGLPVSALARPAGVDPLLAIRLLCLGVGSLTFAGGLLLLPRLLQQPLVTLGIGPGRLKESLPHAALILLCLGPGLVAVSAFWNILLAKLGLDAAPQKIVSSYGTAIEGGQLGLILSICAMTVVVAPIVEELLFRSLLFRWMESRWGTRVGVIGSGIAFGLIHLSLGALLPISLLGMLLAVVLARTGNITTCIVLHALFNGSNLLLIARVLQSSGGS
jgi:membrane protease YdiL (CAAX protease family)